VTSPQDKTQLMYRTRRLLVQFCSGLVSKRKICSMPTDISICGSIRLSETHSLRAVQTRPNRDIGTYWSSQLCRATDIYDTSPACHM